MLSHVSVRSLAVLLFTLAPLRAQTPPATPDAPSPIATDRPSFTNSSIVVPAGSIQAENGFLVTNSQSQNIFDATETSLRIGILSKTELRFAVPDYYHNLTTGGGPNSGFGDFALGVKQQLGPLPGGFDVSVTAFLSFPTGAAGVSSGGYDPGLQVAWSRALSPNWTLAGMLSLYDPTVDQKRNFTGESTFLLDRQLTKPWDVFVEYVGDFPERGGTRQLLNFGSSYKLTPQQQLDFHVAVGLTSAAADHLVGVGYSFRFQAFHRK
jgi:hypothetical protein